MDYKTYSKHSVFSDNVNHVDFIKRDYNCTFKSTKYLNNKAVTFITAFSSSTAKQICVVNF